MKDSVIIVSGDSISDLKAAARKIAACMHQIEGINLIRTNFEEPLPGIRVTPDATEANRLGVNKTLLSADLAIHFGDGIPMSTLWEGDYPVKMVLKSENDSDLANEYIPVMGGTSSVPLRQLARISPDWHDGCIVRRNGIRTISIVGEPLRGYNANQLSNKLKEEVSKLPLGTDLDWEIGGMAYVADKDADVKQKAHAFAEGYKKFLDNGKTEREVAAESEQMLKDAGYVEFDPKKTYQPGDKVYFVQFKKAVVASTIGTRSFEDGFRLVIAHTDSPRLDLRPTPLYESDHLSYFKTHYYGGIRKYQWGTMPLSIHGVFTRDDGTTVTVRVGEDEGDPVFCITDLLPHLGAEQSERKLSDGIRAEELNILIGSDAVDDENVKEAVKLNTMILLNEKYGITEKEFMRAEIEITPAYKCRDVGFDRSMVGGYGHDDRVDAYPALMAEIETKNPAYTTVCVLTDKEEIGSDGVTGMQSMYAFHFMQELCRTAGQDDILAFRHSVCLSADVTAAYDPTWASAFEPMNGTYAGRGVAIFKYTGGGSKGSASDACAELVSDITRMLDNGSVAWQIGELGRLDLGGGGTIAKYVANRGIKV